VQKPPFHQIPSGIQAEAEFTFENEPGLLRDVLKLLPAGVTVQDEEGGFLFIETFEELAYLQAATRIRYAQGFYFSRAIFLEELKLVAPAASEARVSLAGRPAHYHR
jgi:hypothetical protein